jgi:two-component system NarL family response regulator
LVADPVPLTRKGLTALIRESEGMELAAEADGYTTLHDAYLRTAPDVTVLNPFGAIGEGRDPIAMIRREDALARIVIVTLDSTGESIDRALRAGVRSYLPRDASLEQVATAIRTVHSGGSYIPAAIGEKLAEFLRKPQLTPRERDVLDLLVAGRNNKEIQSLLVMSASTTKTHVTHILRKLGVADRTGAVSIALSTGLAQPRPHALPPSRATTLRDY